MDNRMKLSASHLTRGAGALILAAMLIAGSAALAETASPPGATVPYRSGGVSDESLSDINASASDYNLKLVFAMKTGEFLADVGVKIADTRGNTLLETRSDGPVFLARLPAGTYTVVSTNDGKSESRTVSVGNGKRRTVDFRW